MLPVLAIVLALLTLGAGLFVRGALRHDARLVEAKSTVVPFAGVFNRSNPNTNGGRGYARRFPERI